MKSRRLLAILLTVGMLLGMLPGAAFAEEDIPAVVEGLAICETCGEDPCVCEEEPSSGPETPETEETEAPETETEKPEEEGGEPEPQEPEADSFEEEPMMALTLREEELVETGEDTVGVTVTGVKGADNQVYGTMQEAYEAVKNVLESMPVSNGDALGQGVLIGNEAKAEFEKVFDQPTTLAGHEGVKLTWTIYGRVEIPSDLGNHYLSGGRSAAWYGSDEMTIREIEVVGGNAAAELVMTQGPEMPYQWWGDTTDDYFSLTIAGVTLSPNNANRQLSVGGGFRSNFDYTIENCTVNGTVYFYFHGTSKLAVRDCIFAGSGQENYAFMAQGHESEPLSVEFVGNTVSGYRRGINIDQVTAEVAIVDNTITPGVGYSAVQLSGFQTAVVEGNTVYDQGNFLTLHEKLAKNQVQGRSLLVKGNAVKAVEGIQGYLIYDDITAAGVDVGELCLELTMERNEIDESIITTHGIKGGTVYETKAAALVAEVDGKQYTSLQKALDAAGAGDTVIVLRDTEENITLPLKSLTLTAEGENKPVLKGEVSFAKGAMADGAQVVIENLAFENTYIKLVTWGNTTNLNKMGGLTIRNNTFTGKPENGTGNIYAIHINNGEDAVKNLTITGNEFTNCGLNDGGCVYATACGELVVKDNVFQNSAMNALTLIGKDSAGNGTTSAAITGNVFDQWAVVPENRGDGRAMRLSNFGHDVDLRNNSFVSSNLPEEYIKLTGLGEGKKADADKCYWGGEAPAAEKLQGISPVLSYYADEAMTQLVVGAAVVAEVDGRYYSSLQEAVKAAPAGGSVQVLKDVSLSGAINPGKEITIEGINKEDGSKPVISGAKGLFSFTTASGTLKNLELQATGNTWYIYHSAGVQTGEVKLTVSGCEFTMAEGVNAVGNLVMTEGTKTKTPLVFTGNTVKAHSRVAFAGPGDNTVITDNVIDLMGEQYAGGGRTSMIGLTATAETGDVVITGNEFRNANRVLAVDNAPNMPADKLTFQNNKFIDCRWAFELKGSDEREFNINYNYYSFGGQVSEPRVEDADGAAGHFDDGNAYAGEGIVNDVYYTTEAMERTLNLTPATVSIRVGNTAALAATSETMAGTVTWTSSNPTVASVTESGVVTAVAEGSAVITATLGETTATCTVTVTRVTSGGGSSTTRPTRPTRPEENLGENDVPLAQPLPFVDVAEEDWFHEAVRFVFERDMMKGINDGTLFEPTMNTTRGMIVTVLYRLEGEPEAAVSTFSDVERDTWYAAAVDWAAANGVVKGYEDGSFRPENTITRQEMAAILSRYAAFKGYDKSAVGDMSLYNDKTLIAEWALEDMTWAVGVKVLSGKGNNLLDPLGTASRAEAAQMLKNFSEAFEAKTEG